MTELTIVSPGKQPLVELNVIAVKSYNPSKDILGNLDLESTEPELSEQLLVKKGQTFLVQGKVDWWLYVKSDSGGKWGYIPSTHVVPMINELTETTDDLDLKYFPQFNAGKDNRKPCPEDIANILSKLTFWWLNRLVYKGFKNPLQDSDMWALRNANKCSNIAPNVAIKWNNSLDDFRRKAHKHGMANGNAATQEVDANGELDSHDQQKVEFVPKAKETKKNGPSLTKILFSIYWKRFLLVACFKLVHDICIFIQPQMLDYLIIFSEEEDDPSTRWKGYLYCLAIFGSAIVQSMCLHQYFHRILTIGMNLRTAIIGMVYPKALRINNASRSKSTAGEMVNLMTTDAQRIMDLMVYVNTIWSGPFQIIIALYFLYDTMGVSVIAGVAVMLLLIPINIVFSKALKKVQVEVMSKTDSRLKMINEMLNGIKILKLYAWEESMHQKVMEIRNSELKKVRSSMILNSFFQFTYTCAPFMVSLATFAIYVTTGNVLTANKAFVAIALFQILRFPLVMFPNIIMSIVQARVSMKRLENFLSLDEIDENNVSQNMPEQFSSQAIHVEDCTIAWDKNDSPILKDINLNISEGSLVAVVGQVGCGKSTLLSALLGDTERLGGNVCVKGSVAYVPQQAWIQNATLRDNILFSKSYDRRLFKQTVKNCALQTDLDLLPAGEMTEIGEKGINLSGGQKQRVNLARAVYFNADVYLFDDPLSAVDSHVGKHIFDKVIGPRGVLQGKTRVLVTHAVHFLPQVDQIVVLQGGRISEIGTYDELQSNQGAFAEFLKTYANEKLEDEDEETNIERVASTENLDEPQITNQQLSRCRSKTTLSTETSEEGMEIRKVIEDETSEIGRVKLSVYLKYAKAMGVIFFILVMLFTSLAEGSLVASKIWLAHWSSLNVTTDKQRDFYLGMYGGFGLYQAFFTLISSLVMAGGGYIASRALHDVLLKKMLRYPMSFFESTPQGRIVNRFSKDMFVIDDTLPRILSSFFRCFIEVMSSIFVISYATPYFIIVVVPLAGFYLFIQRLYVSTSRQLRRIESVSRSPIYNNFLETINGVSTIRAYSLQQHFIRGNQFRVDENQVAYYPYIASNRWLAVRLELVGNLVVFFAAIFAVAKRGSIESGLVGLSLTQAMKITQTLNWMVRMSSELETNVVAVERVKEYSEIDTEAEWVIEDHRPPENWPGSGNIVIDNFDLRYRENLPLVLKNINCDIKPGEKIGIVGRTGAGKSSLSLALFRILESCGGKIMVDGIDISKIGLHDLRSRLTIIPQDPVLFSGTLRFNLDPFDTHTDEELWNVLEISHLKQFVSGLAEGLEHAVTEGGENLSVGQRQLVCLARALLRKSKVLVLDEATAAVDLETDELIQKTIRTEFADRTTLTIAHRLNTIMDYSRILVMDKGFAMEFDSPSSLIEKRGMFYSMVKDAGLA